MSAAENEADRLRAEVARLSASRDRWRVAAGRLANTLCPECGPGAKIDKDWRCACCGNVALGAYAIERAEVILAADSADMDAEAERLRAIRAALKVAR